MPETPGHDPHAATHASPSGLFATAGGPVSDAAIEKDPLLRSVPATAHGRLLGGVRLVKKLGQGGMGAVYAGWHAGMGTLVAVKVLPGELVARDHQYVDRFLREARISFQITHQHLVSTKDVGHEHGLLFLVMELVEGKSAQRLLDEKSRLAEGEAIAIVHDATLGLAEAHRANVVHRDVKPDNILVRARDGQAKLADLGLARASHEARDVSIAEQLTVSGTALGTPLFMAPEQTLDAHAVGVAADVWSMGATLFALLAGKAPFMARDLLGLYEAIRSGPAPDLAKIRPDVSRATIALVRRCLEKDPARRPRDASALAEELGRIRATLARPGLSISSAEAKTIPLGPLPSQNQTTHAEPARTEPTSAPTIPPSSAATISPTSAPTIPPQSSTVTFAPESTKSPAPGSSGIGFGTLAVVGLLVAIGLAGFAGALVVVLFFPGSSPTPTPAPSPTPTTLASPPNPIPKPTPTSVASTPVPLASTPALAPTPTPAPARAPTPAPSAAPTPSPAPSPAPTPTPTPTPTPSPSASVPVAQLAPEERTWDGHGWRRAPAGHRHAKDSKGQGRCGHFYDSKLGGWKFFASEPVEYSLDMTDEERANPASGVYDFQRKTWYLRGHTHDALCCHVLRDGRWYLKDPEP